jgi:hypothetical protein
LLNTGLINMKRTHSHLTTISQYDLSREY